ncbi:sugar transporter (plasmid) [Acetobacter pasteurianus NBRC 101655]|nr:sugar transporter [Acetobacter pasteurianus NBRC 101655]CCT60792.1 sugar transporter [Acetobacter pasteurianus 386B]
MARGCTVRHPPASVRQNLLVILRHLLGNRRWVLSNLLAFFYFVGQAALFGFALYYARIVLGGTEQLGANIITFVTVLLFAGVPACLPLARRMGTVGAGIICLIVQGIAYLAMAVASASITGFFLSIALLALAQGVMSPLYYTFLAEAVDDGDSRTSTGSAGLAYSINTWVTKLAMGLTGFVLAQFLSQGHYVEGGTTQSSDLSFWITAGFVWGSYVYKFSAFWHGRTKNKHTADVVIERAMYLARLLERVVSYPILLALIQTISSHSHLSRSPKTGRKDQRSSGSTSVTQPCTN